MSHLALTEKPFIPQYVKYIGREYALKVLDIKKFFGLDQTQYEHRCGHLKAKRTKFISRILFKDRFLVPCRNMVHESRQLDDLPIELMKFGFDLESRWVFREVSSGICFGGCMDFARQLLNDSSIEDVAKQYKKGFKSAAVAMQFFHLQTRAKSTMNRFEAIVYILNVLEEDGILLKTDRMIIQKGFEEWLSGNKEYILSIDRNLDDLIHSMMTYAFLRKSDSNYWLPLFQNTIGILLHSKKLNSEAEKWGIELKLIPGLVGLYNDIDYLDKLKTLEEGIYTLRSNGINYAHTMLFIKQIDSCYLWDPNFGLFLLDPEDPKSIIIQMFKRDYIETENHCLQLWKVNIL